MLVIALFIVDRLAAAESSSPPSILVALQVALEVTVSLGEPSVCVTRTALGISATAPRRSDSADARLPLRMPSSVAVSKYTHIDGFARLMHLLWCGSIPARLGLLSTAPAHAACIACGARARLVLNQSGWLSCPDRCPAFAGFPSSFA